MHRWALLVAAAVAAAASPAIAADDPAQPAQGVTQGPMTVERVDNGWVIAPDVQVGRVGHTTATMAGAYGGYMFENTILIGGAGYWQLNRSAARKIDYAGAIVEWLAHTDRAVGFGARALVGGGQASLNASLAGVPIEGGRDDRLFVTDPFFSHHIPVDLPVRLTTVRFRREFAIFEPQADVLFNLGTRLRVRAAAGYRFIGAGEGWNSQLRGPSGSIGVEFGGSSSKRVGP